MSGKSIADALIKGQNNLDGMRKEIQDIILMFVGLIRSEDGFLDSSSFVSKERRKVFESEACEWVVDWRDGRDFPRVECWLKSDGAIKSYAYELRLIASAKSVLAPIQYIQRVRECLDVFIEGVLNTSPKLNNALQPYLEAAEK